MDYLICNAICPVLLIDVDLGKYLRTHHSFLMLEPPQVRVWSCAVRTTMKLLMMLPQRRGGAWHKRPTLTKVSLVWILQCLGLQCSALSSWSNCKKKKILFLKHLQRSTLCYSAEKPQPQCCLRLQWINFLGALWLKWEKKCQMGWIPGALYLQPPPSISLSHISTLSHFRLWFLLFIFPVINCKSDASYLQLSPLAPSPPSSSSSLMMRPH